MNSENLILTLDNIVKKYHKNAIMSLVPDNLLGHCATNAIFINKDCEKDLCNDLAPYAKEFILVGGFLNIILKDEYLESIEFNKDFGGGATVSLEYCSPNPTGDLHLGHCRGIAVGKTMDNILRYTNHNVKSELYMNDCGNQINDFCNTIRYWQEIMNTGHSSIEPKYLGDYMKDLAMKYSPDNIVEIQVNNLINKLKSIGVTYDRITKESTLDMTETLKLLEEKNLLKTEDGKLWFGDKVLRREDGTFTYFANDITYHFLKKEPRQLIVLGEDQRGNFSHLQELLQLFSIDLRVILIGTVHVRQDGELLKLSKRKGQVISLDYLLETMSIAHLFCALLDANLHKSVVIDMNQELKDNTVFHIEYVNNKLQNMDTSELSRDILTAEEHKILGLMLFWPKALRDSVNKNDPHRIFVFIKQFIGILYEYLCNNTKINYQIYNPALKILQGIYKIIHGLN